MAGPEERGAPSGLIAVPGVDPYRGATDDPQPHEGGWTAAVAVVLRPRDDSTEVLLIERAESKGDPWSGHMALPGGRHEARDRTLLETAVRETFEETAIELNSCGRALGRLEVVEPESVHLARLSVLPLVFAVPAGTVAGQPSPEVAHTFWTPLDRLLDPRNQSAYHRRAAGGTLSFPAIALEGRLVWGLTRRILNDLLARLR